MSGKIGAAIIGSDNAHGMLGIFVKAEHLPAVLASEQLELKAIYSRTLKSAQALFATLSPEQQPNVDVYSSDLPGDEKRGYEALLARSDVGAVIVALPILVQTSFIKQALEAGKHVLAEKPLAKDVETGRELIDFYDYLRARKNATFAVAEQFRYLSAFQFGAARAREFGRVLGFRHRMNANVKEGNQYFETSWRKTPEYQGGFVLDGGVHFVAGMRMLLGQQAKVAKVSAFTTQLQPHLPPMDTVDATIKLANGATGHFSVSFGTTFTTPAEWSIACEKGSLSISGSTVRVQPLGGEEEVVEKADESGVVKQEVFAWAKGLMGGEEDKRQSAEEALADLEVVEAMVRSGEEEGQAVGVRWQV